MIPPLQAPATSAPVAPTSTTSQAPVTSGTDTTTAQPSPVMSSPKDVTTGLTAPWSVAFVDGVALVSERDSGRILELGADGTAREVGVIGDVRAGGEGGLLGLAVDQQKMLYAYYTTARDNRIVRFDLAGSPGDLALGEKTVIVEGLHKSSTHNGGRIAFGPDGMLYASAGDAGVPQRSQDRQSLAGKILRMTSDGAVPPGNPFEGSLVWSLGHRNVQGMAWTSDGTMFATEFGQNTWDELNIIEPGNNYGWPVVEGIARHADFVDPVQQWTPGEASPSGMAYLDGTLYIANLRGQRLRGVDVSDPSSSRDVFDGTYGRLRDVAVAPDGALWVMTNNTDGRGNPHPGDDRIVAVPRLLNAPDPRNP
ncbi:PQQ-dependent sugar dehydrogenase [Tessaracoccus antarcticus]|uniref:PQQ-dependent sugar dehydrogenase n=2 Tax=Tessaracoccus antarcticus TaxID=2479848 RepID=A0A3M0G824_9ACTN|nr:PQQ-dependent sugar dehydrogenase [Tessaracoccus antarcticus]